MQRRVTQTMVEIGARRRQCIPFMPSSPFYDAIAVKDCTCYRSRRDFYVALSFKIVVSALLSCKAFHVGVLSNDVSDIPSDGRLYLSLPGGIEIALPSSRRAVFLHLVRRMLRRMR